MIDRKLLRERAEEVRNEAKIGANTAARVGRVLVTTLDVIEEQINETKAEDERILKLLDVVDKAKVEARDVNKSVESIEENIVNKVNVLEKRVDEIKPVIIQEGSITNNPDEETLTASNGVIGIKNRDALSGKGYVILKKGVSAISQITAVNTIYEVRYDYDLAGATLTMPSGCELNFQGGKITNGKVVLNGTRIQCCNGILAHYITAEVSGTYAVGQLLYDRDNLLPKWYDGQQWVDATGAKLGSLKTGFREDRPRPQEAYIPIGSIFMEKQVIWDEISGDYMETGEYIPYWWTGQNWVDAEGKMNALPKSGSWEGRPQKEDYAIPDGYMYLLYISPNVSPGEPIPAQPTIRPIWYSKDYDVWVTASGSIINI